MRLWITLWTVLAVSFLTGIGRQVVAQFNGVQVNIDEFGMDILGDAANEPSIAVDPNNPNRIAIGWRQFDTITSNFRQAGAAYTTDGGQTWTATTLDPGQFRSDPVLDFDADGNFYYSSLAIVQSNFQVDVFKSTDGGATWSDPPAFAWGGDKQWIAIDRTGGIGHGNIYQHWSVQGSGFPNTNFTRSIDAGSSFETSMAGPQPFMKWGTMDVGPGGTLYMVGAELDTNDGHLFSTSTNAKDPGQTPTFLTSQTIDLGGTTEFFNGGPVNPGGLLGQPQISSDHSFTDRRGNLYVLGSVDPLGPDPLNVMFIRSEDGGNTWGSPVRVNDDTGTDAYQWFGTMSVAPNGRIDVIWNDTRNDATELTSELFYSSSFDGGQSWSDSSTLSDPFANLVGFPQQDKLGDYYDMISDNTGAHLAWAATFTGGQDVYYLRIDADILCDFDDDRLCGVSDINEMLSEGPIADGVPVIPGVNDQFDLNGDDVIDLDDRDDWLALAGSQNGLMSPYLVADSNLDGTVDGGDFLNWNEHKFTATLLWDEGNFNGDSFNDGLDFLEWNLTKFMSSDGVAVAVPEPSGVLAVLLMVAGLALSRSRLRAAS